MDNFRKYLDEKASNNDTSVDSLFHGVIAAMLSTQCLDKVALAAAKVFEKKFQNPVESEQSIIVLDFSRVRKETIITRAPMSG